MMFYSTIGQNPEQKKPVEEICGKDVLPAALGVLAAFAGSLTGSSVLAGVSGGLVWAGAYFLMPKCKVN